MASFCSITIGSALVGEIPGSIVQADTILQWTPTTTVTATTSPVEDGTQIADNLTVEPRTFTASLMFASNGEPGLQPFGVDRPDKAVTILQDAMASRKACRVVIEGRVYDPAAITSLVVQRNNAFDSRTIDIQVQEIRIVQARRVRVAARVRRKFAKQRKVVQPTRGDLAVTAAVEAASGRWVNAIITLGASTL